jgi:hypothetical protein
MHHRSARERRSPVRALLDESSAAPPPPVIELDGANFDLCSKLYSTGDSAVFKALYKGQYYAIKQRVTAELGAKGDMLHEVKLLASFDHEHIVRCLGVYWAPAHVLHMVFEWAAGGDLLSVIRSRRIKGGPPPEAALWRWAGQLFAGLACIHARRVIHRDVKPSNILLFPRAGSGGAALLPPPAEAPLEWDVRLGDLGVARTLRGGGDFASTLYGTPLYMSPELLDAPGLLPGGGPSASLRYTSRTDLWSAGVTLYELSALASPFAGGTMAALSACILGGRYRPLPPCYSVQWTEFVTALLRRAPEQRPSAQAAVEIAQRWLELHAAEVASAAAGMAPPPAAVVAPVPSARAALIERRRGDAEKGALSPRAGEGLGVPGGVRRGAAVGGLAAGGALDAIVGAPPATPRPPALIESVAEAERVAAALLVSGVRSSPMRAGPPPPPVVAYQPWQEMPRGGNRLPAIPAERGAAGVEAVRPGVPRPPLVAAIGVQRRRETALESIPLPLAPDAVTVGPMRIRVRHKLPSSLDAAPAPPPVPDRAGRAGQLSGTAPSFLNNGPRVPHGAVERDISPSRHSPTRLSLPSGVIGTQADAYDRQAAEVAAEYHRARAWTAARSAAAEPLLRPPSLGAQRASGTGQRERVEEEDAEYRRRQRGSTRIGDDWDARWVLAEAVVPVVDEEEGEGQNLPAAPLRAPAAAPPPPPRQRPAAQLSLADQIAQRRVGQRKAAEARWQSELLSAGYG